jgi:phosphatidylglycerophosphatase A
MITRDHWLFRWARLLPAPFVCQLSTLGPLGLMPRAPGTWGSVAGILLYVIVFHSLSPLLQVIVAAILTLLAIGICDAAEQHFQQRDPGKIILDEVVAVPIVFIGMAPMIAQFGGWPVILGGFLLFRFFDVLKPLGIKRLQNLPGGMGCVVDDTAAAAASWLVLQLLFLVFG